MTAHVPDAGSGELRDVAVLDDDGLRPRAQVRWSEGRIISVEGEVMPEGQAHAWRGEVIVPGLLDSHIHGAHGHDFAAGDPGPLLTALAREGVTSVMASLVSAPVPALVERSRRLLEHSQGHSPEAGDQARLVGIHFEGPFLSPGQRGAHLLEALATPADVPAAVLEDFLATPGIVMLTLAAELHGGLDLVEAAAARGWVVSLGHSEADPVVVDAAAQRGARHATHLWSGMTLMRREGPWRKPGLVDACLSSPTLHGEVIADGRHLPPELLEIARRCLPGRLVVVSDATAAAGLPDGHEFDLGGICCVVRDGVGQVVGADAFAGSTTLLPGMLRHLVADLGWPLLEVIPMMTSVPADLLGVGEHVGRLRVGCAADLVRLDADLQVREVWLGGRRVARD